MIPANELFRLCSTDFLSELVGEKVVKASVSTGSTKQGDNISGNLLSIHVKTALGQIHHIIIKVPPYDNLGQFTYIRRRRIFELEVQFYSSFVPALQNYIRTSLNTKGKKLNLDLTKLPVPQYFGGNRDFVALRDLRPEGYKMADKYAGLDWAHVQVVLKELGRFHAMSSLFARDCGLYFKDGDNYCFLSEPTVPHFNPENIDLNRRKFTQFYSQACEILEQVKPDLGKKIRVYEKQAHDLMRGYWRKTNSEPGYFPIMTHGDLWVNNMLFKHGPDGTPEHVMFIDFQQARHENVFYDLSYFMFTSTTPAFRKEYLEKSLNLYFESFEQCYKEMGEEVPEMFTRFFLTSEFQKNLKFIYAYMTFALPLQLGDWSLVVGKPGDLTTPKEFASDEKLLDEDTFLSELNQAAYKLLKETPAALARFIDITEEMDALGVFEVVEIPN